MPDQDFELWRSSPRRFYNLHKDLFERIIVKNSFLGHLDETGKTRWQEEVMLLMESQENLQRIGKYSRQSSFMVFYVVVLSDVVIQKNQQEDLRLLKNDFNAITLKYRPLAEFMVLRIIPDCRKAQLSAPDILQQLLANLLAKKEAILAAYDFRRLFRNFIWKIAENEARNIVKAAIRSNPSGLPDTEGSESRQYSADSPENLLIIQEAIEILHCKLLTYMNQRFKLILCLKVVFDEKIYVKDITEMLDVMGIRKMYEELRIEPEKLNNSEYGESGKLPRFILLQPFLNFADNSKTDANSYWRWTNLEVNKLIEYLNKRHLMQLDRETFGHLLDRYFTKFFSEEIPISD